jgi:hypothetical protein
MPLIFQAVPTAGMIPAWAGAVLDNRLTGFVGVGKAIVAAAVVARRTGTILWNGWECVIGIGDAIASTGMIPAWAGSDFWNRSLCPSGYHQKDGNGERGGEGHQGRRSKPIHTWNKPGDSQIISTFLGNLTPYLYTSL